MEHAYIQVTFPQLSTIQKELLSAALSISDFNGIEEEAETLIVYYEAFKFQEALIAEIAAKLALRFAIRTIGNKNWNEEWERHFQPVLINGFCSVRASFHPKPEKVLYDIVITPKMSFGTGHHATTELMITMMQTLDFKDKAVFDFGTGTGILAILAEKSGAHSVFAMDNDDWAIENARENFEGNAVQRISLEKGSADMIHNRQFDVLLANINRNILLEHMEYFPSLLRSGGWLLLSGILADDREIMQTAAEEKGFTITGERTKDGWLALLFQRNG